MLRGTDVIMLKEQIFFVAIKLELKSSYTLYIWYFVKPFSLFSRINQSPFPNAVSVFS